MLNSLIKFLPLAEKFLDRKSNIPILFSVCLSKGYLQMTDLESHVRMPVEDKRNFTIPLTVLKNILSAKPKLLKIEQPETLKLKIFFDENILDLTIMDYQDYPMYPEDTFKEMGVWSGEIFRQLHGQIPFASTDELRPALTGIFVEQNSVLSACATDGHIMQYISNLDPEKKCRLKKEVKVILPVKAVQTLSKFARGNVRVALGKKYVRFILPGEIECCFRFIDENYVDFMQFFGKQYPHQIRFDKETFRRAIRRALPFTHPLMNRALFQSVNGSLQLKAENPEQESRFVTDIPLEKRDGENLKIGFDLNYLEKALKVLEGDSISWQYRDPNYASIFKGENDHRLLLVMPCRFEEED